MPPQLWRQIYEALELHITVDEPGRMHTEARVDDVAVRYSREVEAVRQRPPKGREPGRGLRGYGP